MLDVAHLSVVFERYGRVMRRDHIAPVTDISLDISAGEIVAVVGASGSGKSLLAHALLGLLPKNSRRGGTISFRGEELDQSSMERLRGREIALIPQSVNYLNPLIRVGAQVRRAGCLAGYTRIGAREAADKAFSRYCLGGEVDPLFPFQLSGGMARRVLTAIATVGQADLLIADEPTTGLDPLTAEKTLDHLVHLAGLGKAVLLITHDLAAAVRVSMKVVVVYSGKTVEITSARSFDHPGKLLHPYSRALWDALPENGFNPLAKEQSPAKGPAGCVFVGHCPMALPACRDISPELHKINGSLVRCLHAAR